MNRHLSRAGTGAAFAVILTLSTLAPPALADWTPDPLDKLLAEAAFAAIVRVTGVQPAPGGGPGAEVATVAVRTPIKGVPAGSYLIAGGERDPGLVDFTAGQDLILFWSGGEARTPGKVVGFDRGAVPVLPAQAGAARALLDTVLARGPDLRLTEVLPYLAAARPARVPSGLLASLLAQIRLRATIEDAQAIARLACRPDDFQPQAARAGIALAGALAVEASRKCLESRAAAPDSPFAIDAVEALGDFGDPRSLGALLSLIPALPAKAFETGTDPLDGVDGPGPLDDPEFEGEPKPDRLEDGDDTPPPPEPEKRVDTGRDEPDDNVSPDDDANGEGPLPPGVADEDDDAPFDSDDLVQRMADGGVAEAAVLALGRIGDTRAVTRIARIAREGNVLALHSTVVNALGLIGSEQAQRELQAISRGHPDPYVRSLAQRTLQRLRG
jgi:hypothetical protein